MRLVYGQPFCHAVRMDDRISYLPVSYPVVSNVIRKFRKP